MTGIWGSQGAEISRIAKQLISSKEGLRYMELVGKLVSWFVGSLVRWLVG